MKVGKYGAPIQYVELFFPHLHAFASRANSGGEEVGLGSGCDKFLASIDNEIVSLPDSSGSNVGNITASVRLGDSEGHDLVSRDDLASNL